MRIRSQSRLRYAWAFAIFWNLVAAPATFLGAVPAIRKGQAVAWVALVFPFVGAGLLIWAIRLTLRFWRFGVSWLELESATAMLGGSLHARIAARRLPHVESRVHLTLSCINRTVTGTGDNRSSWEKVVWQEEQTIEPEQLQPGPEGEEVPVSFRLPFDAPPTRGDERRDQIVWRLDARASLAGVDYAEQFEIPVAAAPPGKEPAHPARTASAAAAGAAPSNPHARPEASRVVVEPIPEGGTRFIVPAGRNIQATRVMAFFTFLFGGGGALFIFLVRGSTSGLFGWLAGGVILAVLAPFTLLLALLTLHTGCLRTVVSASPAGLAIASHILGLSWSARAPAAEVGDIALKIGMQVGRNAYYDLRVRRSPGSALTISAMLRDKREAEWLAGAIQSAIHR